MSKAAERRVEKAVADTTARVINAVGDAIAGRKKKTKSQRSKKTLSTPVAKKTVAKKQGRKRS